MVPPPQPRSNSILWPHWLCGKLRVEAKALRAPKPCTCIVTHLSVTGKFIFKNHMCVFVLYPYVWYSCGCIGFQGRHGTQGLIETLGSMAIFDENQGISDLSKNEFHCPIYVKIIKFLAI